MEKLAISRQPKSIGTMFPAQMSSRNVLHYSFVRSDFQALRQFQRNAEALERNLLDTTRDEFGGSKLKKSGFGYQNYKFSAPKAT